MSEAAQLLSSGTWIQPGPATLVVREAGWVLLVPGSKKEVVEAAWTVLGDGPTADDFLDKLVDAGGLESLDKLPAILYALMDGTTAHIGVKGKTPLAVYTEQGSRLLAGTEDEPLARETVEGVRRIAFGDLPPEESLGGLRLEVGVSRVRGFVQAAIDPSDLDDDARAALAEQVEQDGRSIEDPEAKKRRAEKPPPPPPKASTPSAPLRKPMMATRPAGAMPTSRQASAPAKPSADAGPSVFDDLFGDKKPDPAAEAAPAPAAGPAPATGPAPAATAADSAPAPASSPAPSPSPATPAADEAAKPPEAAAPTEGAPPAIGAGADPVPPPDRDAVAAPVADSSQAPAAEASEAPQPAGKRRLVSTSLFDRKRRPTTSTDEADKPASDPGAVAPASSENAEPAPAPEPAPQPEPESATEPAPQSEPSAPARPAPAVEAPSVAPAAEQQRPSAAPGPSPVASTPTPPPPDEDDDSPVTLVAPIDQDEVAAEESASAPTSAPAPAPAPAQAQSGAADSTASAASLGFGSDLDATGAYDDLFGKTVFRSIEDAAVRRTEEDEHDEEDESTPAAEGSSQDAEDAAAEPERDEDDQPETLGQPATPTAEAASSAIGGEFIDWVPGVGRAAPEIAQTAARRASQPAPAQPAYPQVHLAERPPAPVTGPPRAVPPTYGSAPVTREDLGFAQQPGTPSLQAPSGQPSGPQQFGAAFPGTQAPGSQHQPAMEIRQGASGASGRSASAPHPVAPSGPPPMAAPTSAGQAPAGPSHPQHANTGSAAPAPQAPSRAVMIPGVLCPNGHANSPERRECRACRGPLEQSTRTVQRPPLGYVDISTGTRFVLDRSAVIGRRPRASRVSADDVPQLITVPSPQQDISRSHLELRLEGWHVVATDLGTTNGTTLIRPGMEPVRLRSGEGVVLGEGDQLDLGDGIRLMMRGMA